MRDMATSQPHVVHNAIRARQVPARAAFTHQGQALEKLKKWFVTTPRSEAGGILVLPTGGGKTFTAIRFLCATIIPKGYKVLWLAHTHHLLDQAFEAFGQDVGSIPEPFTSLSTRVVSGTPGHHSPRNIEPTDDVIVATLQTATRAYEERQGNFLNFLRAAGPRLCVVFDEAHHAPAPSYRRLLKALKADHSEMILLGLTATPVYQDERKQGWLKELFPQGIVHQAKAEDLLADRILARPSFEKIPTNFEPEFDEREYQRWVETFRDLPENIIADLAKNRERNALIAKHYVANRERYGKTIIFAERWGQCEQIESFLARDGVRAGSVYSHVDASHSTPEERNARTADDNARILRKYKEGELDVLLNVRMLTEGTDVPTTQTVFLSRQTTSTILLTQMVGRALRGPKAGGTEEAYIVSFEDNWGQKIQWAGFDQLEARQFADDEVAASKRPPVQLISVDLVRRLADQMDSGVNVAPAPFLKLMPVGWYQAVFQTVLEGTEDCPTVRPLVLVFDVQFEGYRQFLDHLKGIDLLPLSSEHAKYSTAEPMIDEAIARFFPVSLDEIGRVDGKSLFYLARHVAQNDGQIPRFFPFEDRGLHDLDAIAKIAIDGDWGQRQIHSELLAEYERSDRFWKNLYPDFARFKTQYQACNNRILDPSGPVVSADPVPPAATVEMREPSDEVKRQVKSRDGNHCLCCGETNARLLQVDHARSWYHGGTNALENLQTLCKMCNGQKGTEWVNFHTHRSLDRGHAPAIFPPLSMVQKDRGANYLASRDEVKDRDLWARSLRRAVNLFYGAAAVDSVLIGGKGPTFYEWTIQLFEGNPPEWISPHLPAILESIRKTRSAFRFDGPERIRVTGPGGQEVAQPSKVVPKDVESTSPLLNLPHETECRLSIDGEMHIGVVRGGLLWFGTQYYCSLESAYQARVGRPTDGRNPWEIRLPKATTWKLLDTQI